MKHLYLLLFLSSFAFMGLMGILSKYVDAIDAIFLYVYLSIILLTQIICLLGVSKHEKENHDSVNQSKKNHHA